MKEIISILFLTVFAGALLFVIPEKYRTFKALSALLISTITGYIAVLIYSSENQLLTLRDMPAISTLTLYWTKYYTRKLYCLPYRQPQQIDCFDDRSDFHFNSHIFSYI